MTKKKQVGVRFDSNRTRLKTGETQRPNGTYAYRWSTPDGKRHSIYAPTLEKLREQEEQIIVDKHDGIRSDVKSITVNEMFNLWCQLKRGIKDSTFKNYIYMYELFVKPSFGKNRLVQVKKSDVRKFYNSLADGKVLKIATIDNVHNVLHQVFQVAVDDGMIRQNPTDNMLKELKLSHGFEREKKEALTVAQQMYGAQNGITVKSNSDLELGMRLVAYLPELHCAVDIAGATVTEKREQGVKAHICQSNRLSYYLIKKLRILHKWQRKSKRCLSAIIFTSIRIPRKMFKCFERDF